MVLIASDEMEAYFENLEKKADKCYTLVEKVRKAGFDPSDSPEIPREVFSIFLFFGKPFKWFMDNKKIDIELGRLYYINTRKLHETVCNEDSSFHVCLRVPQTMENIYKLMNMI